MARTSDRVRAVLVAVMAVAQAAAAPLTRWALGPASNTGAISDANISPVTPADYSFAVWGLIYVACLALAVYQLLPSQQERTVHRLTGWWFISTIHRERALGADLRDPYDLARPDPDRDLGHVLGLRRSRLPADRSGTQHGGGSLSSVAGDDLSRVGNPGGGSRLATTFRSQGMPASARWVNEIGVVLVLSATIMSLFVVSRLVAVVGFLLTACWALLAVAVATDSNSVRNAAVIAIVIMLASFSAGLFAAVTVGQCSSGEPITP